jgi:hypothetical protein
MIINLHQNLPILYVYTRTVCKFCQVSKNPGLKIGEFGAMFEKDGKIRSPISNVTRRYTTIFFLL